MNQTTQAFGDVVAAMRSCADTLAELVDVLTPIQAACVAHLERVGRSPQLSDKAAARLQRHAAMTGGES